MCAGRREQTSLSIYVAFDGPLDQHFMRNPHKLFSRTIETPQVNPSNAVLLQQHLVCASVELPLVPHLDHAFFGPVRPSTCLHSMSAHLPRAPHRQLHLMRSETVPSAMSKPPLKSAPPPAGRHAYTGAARTQAYRMPIAGLRCCACIRWS